MQLKHYISDWLFNLSYRNLVKGNAWSIKSYKLVGTPAGDLCLLFARYHLAVAEAYMKLGTWVLSLT